MIEVYVKFYKNEVEIECIKVDFWDHNELKKDYDFEAVHFAGEIDHYFTVSIEDLIQIHRKYYPYNDHRALEAAKKIDELIETPDRYDKIIIVLWVYYSGY